MGENEDKKDSVSVPEFKNLLTAEKITSVTLVGVNMDKYPVDSGNCFSVHTDSGDYRIVNFAYENMNEVVRRGVNFPITILPISDRVAVVHDVRIPNKWYDTRWCEVCCPDELLPIQQRLSHDREEKQGVRTVLHRSIRINWSKRPDLDR